MTFPPIVQLPTKPGVLGKLWIVPLNDIPPTGLELDLISILLASIEPSDLEAPLTSATAPTLTEPCSWSITVEDVT